MLGNKNDRNRSNAGNTGRKPVKAIHQINNIGKAYNPENRQRHGKILKVKITAPRIVQPFNFNIKQHQHKRRRNLPQQLYFGRQLVLVVQNADDNNYCTAQKQRKNIARHVHGGKHGNDKGQINSKAPQARHNAVMNLASVRFVKSADAKSQFFYIRG